MTLQSKATLSELVNLGHELKKEGKFEQAMQAYERAVELSPNNPLGYLGLAQVYWHRGKLDQAVIQCEATLNIDSNFIPALSLLAGVYEKKNELEKAADLRRAIIKLEPSSGIAHANLASVEMKLGNAKIAIESYKKALTLQPEPPEWFYRGLADSLYQAGQIDQVVDVYLQTIQLYPDTLHYYHQLLSLGYLNEAYQCCEQVLSKDPNHIVLEKFYLLRQVPKRYIEKALEILESFQAERPDDIKLLLNLSKLARIAKEIEKAEKYIKLALDRKPEDQFLLSEIGLILEENKEYDEAIFYYRKSNNPKIKVNLLKCIYNSQKSTQGLFDQELQSAIKNSKAIAFIKDEILQQRGIEYKDHLILYQSSGNVGDPIKHLQLIKPLCIQYGRKAIVFYPNSQSQKDLASLFLDPITPKYVACHFPIDLEIQKTIHSLSMEDEIPLTHLPTLPEVPRMTTGVPHVKNLTYITDESIYSGKAASLGISIELNDNTIGKPISQDQSWVNAVNKFKNLHLSIGKAVLLAPHSVSGNLTTGSNFAFIPLWRKFINILIEKGVNPVINITSEQEKRNYCSKMIDHVVMKDVKFVDLPLDEVIPFIELCGGFAGVRSGLCDLAVFSSKDLVRLCIQPMLEGHNGFGKLPGEGIIDSIPINNTFHIYYVSTENPPSDEEINQLAHLFLNS